MCLHEAANFTQKESTWVCIASRPVQWLDNHLHLFWFGKMCRIPETKFLMSGHNGNGLWWWLCNYSMFYHAVGIQWSSDTRAVMWLKGIFFLQQATLLLSQIQMFNGGRRNFLNADIFCSCTVAYGMVQKCFVKLLSSVFLCTHFMKSNPLLKLPFYVTYATVFYLQLTYYWSCFLFSPTCKCIDWWIIVTSHLAISSSFHLCPKVNIQFHPVVST